MIHLSSKKYSIKYKYSITILPFLVASYLLILLGVGVFYWHSLTLSSDRQKTTLLTTASTILDEDLRQFTLDSSVFLYRIDTQNALQQTPLTNTDFMKDVFYYSSFNNAFLHNLYLVTADGSVLSSQGRISDPAVYGAVLSMLDDIQTEVHKKHGLIHLSTYEGHADTLLISREVYLWTGSSDTTGKIYLGTLIGELNTDRLEQFLSTGDECYSFAIMGENNEVLLNLTPLSEKNLQILSETGQGTFLEQRFMTTRRSLYRDHLQLLLISNETLIYQSAYTPLFFQVVIATISIGAILASVYYVSARIAQEFQFFIRKLEHTSVIDDEAFIHMDTADEFVTLSRVYNRMLARIHKLTDKIHQQKLLTKDAQIENLQAQINPHFLYNTLNCISGLIDLGRTQECKKAIAALANIERMSLKGEPFCTLEKDLSYIRQYTFIQQLRFENKLQFLIDIPDELQKFIIPKLVLQPLIENAVLHGTAEVNRKGIIGLFAVAEKEVLSIAIKDNGPGFPDAYLKDFSASCADRPQNSYGLYNIDKRLKLYFGDSYGLRLSNNPSMGACVTVLIPCCTKEELVKENSRILYRKGDFDHEAIDC